MIYCTRCGGESEKVPHKHENVMGYILVCNDCEAFVPWLKEIDNKMKPVTKEFSKEFLQNMVWGDFDEGFEVLKDDIIDNSRWSIMHEMVFKDPEGLFYLSHYSVGATEQQDEAPYQDDPDMVQCERVEAQIVEETHWVIVKE